MNYFTVVFVVVLLTAHAVIAQPMLRDQRYLNEFPSVERIKAEMKGSDDVDTYARFVAALSVINQFMISDLVRAPNGGTYQMPPAADKIHDRYRVALTHHEIDSPEPPFRDPRYRGLRTKYESDPAFADWLLQKFFTPRFRSDYYAWTHKQIPPVAAVRPYGPIGPLDTKAEAPKVSVPKRFPCAKISVSGPDGVDEGQPVTFTAQLTQTGSDQTHTFNWTVTAGTITSGQGTSSITVDTVREGGRAVLAEVSVGGMEPNCSSTSSAATAVRPPPSRKFDQFGPLRLGDRNARLDNFALQLQFDPTTKGYIVAYAGSGSAKGVTVETLNAMKGYLVWTRAIEMTRIITIDGGYRERPMTELWIGDQRATPPNPSPTVYPSEPKPPARKKRGN